MQRTRQHLLPWLTALALLLAGMAATAHELEHALEQHDEPACALHLLADHTGKTLCATALTAPVVCYRNCPVVSAARATLRVAVTPFHARAPPVSDG